MNFKSFSQSVEQFFLKVGQNNFGNKIPNLLEEVHTLVDKPSEKFKPLCKPRQLSSKHASGHFRLPLESGFFMTRGAQLTLCFGN